MRERNWSVRRWFHDENTGCSVFLIALGSVQDQYCVDLHQAKTHIAVEHAVHAGYGDHKPTGSVEDASADVTFTGY